MSLFRKKVKAPSPLEKFELIKTFVKAKTQFLMDKNFEGMSSDQIVNKIMYQTMDKAIREKLTDEQNAKIDRINEVKSVMEQLKEEVEKGNITEAEFDEITSSKEFKDYTAIEPS